MIASPVPREVCLLPVSQKTPEPRERVSMSGKQVQKEGLNHNAHGNRDYYPRHHLVCVNLRFRYIVSVHLCSPIMGHEGITGLHNDELAATRTHLETASQSPPIEYYPAEILNWR